jgi:L-amino acid N-acyltransferase YncA
MELRVVESQRAGVAAVNAIAARSAALWVAEHTILITSRAVGATT